MAQISQEQFAVIENAFSAVVPEQTFTDRHYKKSWVRDDGVSALAVKNTVCDIRYSHNRQGKTIRTYENEKLHSYTIKFVQKVGSLVVGAETEWSYRPNGSNEIVEIEKTDSKNTCCVIRNTNEELDLFRLLEANGPIYSVPIQGNAIKIPQLLIAEDLVNLFGIYLDSK